MCQLKAENITTKNIEDALNFCSLYEETCINLLQYLVEEKKELKKQHTLLQLANRKVPSAKAFYLKDKIIAVACINRHHFFLYCIPQKIITAQLNLSIELQLELSNLIIKTFKLSQVYALMGEEKIQNVLKEYLFKKTKVKAVHTMYYILMTYNCTYQNKFFSPTMLQPSNKKLPLYEKVIVRQAIQADTHTLLPLQIEYEKEEVSIDNKTFPAYISQLNLANILKNETIYIAEIDSLPIAKANTNARGINWVQLGGIYTSPKYRRRGLGTLTVSALMKHIFKTGKNIALFVNIENTIAIAMYKKLGFIDSTRFMISYFK